MATPHTSDTKGHRAAAPQCPLEERQARAGVRSPGSGNPSSLRRAAEFAEQKTYSRARGRTCISVLHQRPQDNLPNLMTAAAGLFEEVPFPPRMGLASGDLRPWGLWGRRPWVGRVPLGQVQTRERGRSAGGGGDGGVVPEGEHGRRPRDGTGLQNPRTPRRGRVGALRRAAGARRRSPPCC